jgi:hypothetical protein
MKKGEIDLSIKLIHSEEYKGFTISISAKYKKDYYSFKGRTEAVYLYYTVRNADYEEIEIDDSHVEIVAKQQPHRLLFWKIKPRLTFKQQVEGELTDLIYYLKREIDRRLHEQEVTEGLLDSLDNL